MTSRVCPRLLTLLSLAAVLSAFAGCRSNPSGEGAFSGTGWHEDYVERQKRKTGFVFSSKVLSRTEDQDWTYAHPLANHDFNSIIGDNTKGLIKELNAMPHPPYVKAKDLTVQLAASVGFRAEEGSLIKRSYTRLVIFFEIAVDRDTFRNASWDAAVEGLPQGFVRDYSKVIGYPLLGIYDAFPETVDQNRVVVQMKFVVVPASTAGGESAGSKPVEFQYPILLERKPA